MVHNDRSTRLNRLPGWLAALAVVAAVIFIWLLYTPAGLLGKADAIGYSVCHRIDLRSFHLGERQLPLCVRCTGMFMGALLGLGYQAWRRPRSGAFSPRRVWPVLGVLFAAFAADGVNSYLHLFPGFSGLYPPQHWLRLLTGLGMGLTLAIVLYPAFHQTVWQNWERTPAVGSLRDLAILLGLALILAGVIWTQSPVVLYPLALLSAAGVLAILILVYTMVAVMVLKRENQARFLPQLGLPLIIGVGLTFLQIGAFDYLRFALTGSWDGFHFG